MSLKDVSTDDLIAELENRKGVTKIAVGLTGTTAWK